MLDAGLCKGGGNGGGGGGGFEQHTGSQVGQRLTEARKELLQWLVYIPESATLRQPLLCLDTHLYIHTYTYMLIYLQFLKNIHICSSCMLPPV